MKMSFELSADHRAPDKSRSGFIRSSAGVVLACLALLSTGKADTIDWTNASGGLWNVPENWSTGNVPGNGDVARLTTISGNYTVNYNSVAASSPWKLELENTGSNKVTLNINAAGFATAGYTLVRRSEVHINAGGVFDQTSDELRIYRGSTVHVNGGELKYTGGSVRQLVIGRDVSGPGTYATLKVSNGGLVDLRSGQVGSDEYALRVGNYVKGSLEIDGGEVRVRNIYVAVPGGETATDVQNSRVVITDGVLSIAKPPLYGAGLLVGTTVGSTNFAGRIELHGGEISSNALAAIRTGSTVIQTGGTWNNTKSNAGDSVWIYGNATSGSNYYQSGGTLNVTNASYTANLAIGTSTGTHLTSTFDKTGGTLIVDNLVTNASGALVSGEGQVWGIRGDFVNTSVKNEDFDMLGATLHFQGDRAHVMNVLGEDMGLSFEGYVGNFAIGAIRLDSEEDTLTFNLSGELESGALYLDALLLDDISWLDHLFAGEEITIYYNKLDVRNGYLEGQDYVLTGGGQLLAIPEPNQIALLVFGLGFGGMLILHRKRRAC